MLQVTSIDLRGSAEVPKELETFFKLDVSDEDVMEVSAAIKEEGVRNVVFKLIDTRVQVPLCAASRSLFDRSRRPRTRKEAERSLPCSRKFESCCIVSVTERV